MNNLNNALAVYREDEANARDIEDLNEIETFLNENEQL